MEIHSKTAITNLLNKLEVARITPEELRDRIGTGESLYVLDLRTARDNHWPSNPGALRLSIEDLTNQSELIPRDREIILDSACTNEASSARAALLLKYHGINQVRLLQGGAEGWARMMQLRV